MDLIYSICYIVTNVIVIFIINTDNLITWSSSSSSSVYALGSIDIHNLRHQPNTHVTSDDVTKMTTVQSKSGIHCVVLCLNKPECLSISFNTDTMVCHVNELAISSPGAVVVYDTKHRYTEIINRVEWYLAFRATQGIGVSAYDSWIDQGHHDDVTEVTSNTIGCLTVDGRLPCDKHLRTWRLDDWTNVTFVKYALFTDSQEVFYVTFDASGTTSGNRDDHFRLSRVVYSSATQLIGFSSANSQSVSGLPACGRRFYLSHFWDGCNSDSGWLMVSDGNADNSCCDFDKAIPYPTFLYTTTTKSEAFNGNNVKSAQVFAVYLKYDD